MRFLLADGLLLVLAMWLMLSAAYPENFNSFALLPRASAWLGKKLSCCAKSEKPRPLERRDSTPRAISRGNSGALPRGLQRQNYSNSRVWI